MSRLKRIGEEMVFLELTVFLLYLIEFEMALLPPYGTNEP